jgi:hypothetical protein
MQSFRARCIALCICFAPLGLGHAAPPQATPAQPVAAVVPAAPAMNQDELAQYVKKEFGTKFTLSPMMPRGVGGQIVKGAAPIVLLTADLDGDGMEDAVIVVQSKNPMVDEKDFNYKVIDPYDGYFGFGDVRITRQFTTQDTENEHILLIVHSWRQTVPKAKYAIINLPFENLSIDRVVAKKKTRVAIKTEEGGILTSSVYWDGKRYRYEPGTGDAE